LKREDVSSVKRDSQFAIRNSRFAVRNPRSKRGAGSRELEALRIWYPVLLHQPPHRRAADLQLTGSRTDFASMPCEGGNDRLPIGAFARRGNGAFARLRDRRWRDDLVRQVIRAKLGAAGNRNRSLNYVFELTNISRERVRRKQCPRRIAAPFDRPPPLDRRPRYDSRDGARA